MSLTSARIWDYLPDHSTAQNKTAVYLELRRPSEEVSTIQQAIRYVRQVARPIKSRLVPSYDSDLTVRVELCEKLGINAGYSPHHLGKGDSELLEILRVLKANAVEVTLR